MLNTNAVISYVIFEVPSNLILSKTKPSVFLPVIMVSLLSPKDTHSGIG